MSERSTKPEIDLEFKDFLKEIEEKLGKDEWITAYSSSMNDFESVVFYCALISNDKVDKSLCDPSRDLSIGSGFPGFTFHYEDGKEVGEYYRFPNSGVEPLIYWRDFHGIKGDYYEISEEFRHYFNLYEDRSNNKFIAIDDDGDEEDVILMSDKKIQIKLKYIKVFLAVKKMHLAIFFDFNRCAKQTIEELGIKDFDDVVQKDNYVYSIGARNWSAFRDEDIKSQGWLMGKKLIAGLKDFEPKLFDKKEEYEDFIISVDDEGKEILHTCDPEKLDNYFGKNPGALQFLTPVFFRKEVLNDYYANPEKYSVEDGYLRCEGLWVLKMDNNHSKYVVVFLGYLGQILSIKEQRRWKRFNITPQGEKISRTEWERGFMGEFADPEQSDLYFKQKFKDFQGKWEKKYGWKLFRPLSKEDEHHFKTLRIPLTNEQKEFDEQVLSFTKIFIDSLNEKELINGIKALKENAKGIDKFEAFLNSKGIQFKGMLEFLRNLQALRSAGIAHLKGEKYEKIKKAFSIGEKEFSIIFDDILTKAIWTLNSLEKYFLHGE
ncbi:hypothetical protein GOV03_00695 [Candidatus Woesearchaeota archaeon]|nr:hypothetical protein [Candidatus Woesearchaeota archaeon]